MIKTLRILGVFYRKIITPSIITATVFGLTGYPGGLTDFAVFFLRGLSFSLLFYHLLIYELMTSVQYYFHFNLGWSKRRLWIINGFFSLGIYILSLIP